LVPPFFSLRTIYFTMKWRLKYVSVSKLASAVTSRVFAFFFKYPFFSKAAFTLCSQLLNSTESIYSNGYSA
jgi:hypothetical protein